MIDSVREPCRKWLAACCAPSRSGGLYRLLRRRMVRWHQPWPTGRRSSLRHPRCVVVALPSAAGGLLSRELLYSAVTRARQRVAIVGPEHSLRQAALVRETERRCTRLAERLHRPSEGAKGTAASSTPGV